jgi:hypothetical protein
MSSCRRRAAGVVFAVLLALLAAVVAGAAPARSGARADLGVKKLVPTDVGPNWSFGTSVAISGKLAVVGAESAFYPAGAAYVFERTPSGWIQAAELTVPGSTFLGRSVAITGTTDPTVVVGSRDSAYVFVRSDGAWTLQAQLVPSGGGPLGQVAVSGATAAVGGQADGSTSAYVFVRSGTVWSEQARLTSPDDSVGFGDAVAVSGSTVVVGAPEGGGDISVGSAFVFVRLHGKWSLQEKLQPGAPTPGGGGDRFGNAVAMSGSTLVVGARFANSDDGLYVAGKAYVFGRSGSTWTEQATLIASDRAESDQFGFAVALSGSTIVVGAPFKTNPAGSQFAGAVYVFVQSDGVWPQRAELQGAARGTLGGSVSVSGLRALAGEPHRNRFTGRAYVLSLAGL